MATCVYVLQVYVCMCVSVCLCVCVYSCVRVGVYECHGLCVTTSRQPSYQSSPGSLVEREFLVQACINRLAVLQDLKNSLASAPHLTVETQRLQVVAYYCM